MEIEDNLSIREVSQEIADKSIIIERNLSGILPIDLKKGSKILMIGIVEPNYHVPPTNHEFDAMKDEFEKAGMIVDAYTNINHRKVKELMDNYDVIVVCSNISCLTYHGATEHVGWNNIHLFWQAIYLLTQN